MEHLSELSKRVCAADLMLILLAALFASDAFAQPGWPAHEESLENPFRVAQFEEEIPPGGLDWQGLPPIADPSTDEMEYFVPLPMDDEVGNCGCGGCFPAETRAGRFLGGLYHAICCPDPCYAPRWFSLADAAFFVDAARPVTQTRLRWDAGSNLRLPDRSEYFWARTGGGGRGPAAIETQLDYDELGYYTEIAHGKFSAFTEIPYRSVDPERNPHAAGFGDIVAGTKSMLLDSELIQLTLQMKFVTPVGVPTKGLGTGHLSIEPSLLLGLNLSPVSYLQAQVAEWIPIAGDPAYAGAILHYHLSFNRMLAGTAAGVHTVGVVEFSGWSFQDGAFSDPRLGTLQAASDTTYLSGGVGLRMILCETVDLGVGTAAALTSDHWAERLYRAELRIRY